MKLAQDRVDKQIPETVNKLERETWNPIDNIIEYRETVEYPSNCTEKLKNQSEKRSKHAATTRHPSTTH